MRRTLIALLSAVALAPVFAARVVDASPQGEVADPRQVRVRFDSAVVPAGDPRRPAPFTLACNGTPLAGDARWANDRTWLFDLAAPLPAGRRCVLRAEPAWQPLSGALEGPTEFVFTTAPLAVQQTRPYPGSRIDEQQQFLLRFNGDADARAAKAAWCEVDGLRERVALRVVDGAPRQALLKAQRIGAEQAARWLVVACERPFPADTQVRVVWGRRFEWTVRPRLLAEFSCERERANAPCLPLRPMSLRFSAPVPRAAALGARLVPAQGAPLQPKAEPGDWVSEVQFAAPLPPLSKWRLTLPAGLQDDAGRTLANAAAFPLSVATGPLPPLAKFAGAAFGIVEAGPDAALPMTLRHVQADLAGASASGQLRVKRLDAAVPDIELMRWLARVQQWQSSAWEAREQSLLATEADVARVPLPASASAEPQATEVVGVPLPQRGLHLVEAESRVLGHALLAQKQPMYVRTAALVTNLGVHFKRGRTASLVWVTTLDRGRPVAGAAVAVNDCRGKPLWNGTTDANGIARIARGFDDDNGEGCISRDGLMVSARAAGDLSFVYADWARGIESWRFDLPTARGTAADRRAHTVFDRTLLRAGESVGMKHFVRDEVPAGLALPAPDTLPDRVLITHVATGAETELPLAWPRGARSTESRWTVPSSAKLGSYDVALARGERRWGSGSVRVEAFRVPLVDARLSAPPGPLVAPAELAFSAQLNLNAGGPLAKAPLKLSALLRPEVPGFAGFEDFTFQPPRGERARAGGDDEDEPGDGAKLVAERLTADTDAQGAARIAVKSLPKLEGPAQLTAELTFDDPNGEVQTVSQRLALWPAAVMVGLRTRHWAAVRGESRFTAVVLDTAGKPLAGRELQVAGRVHETLSVRKRLVGGFYAYDNQRRTRELGVLCSGRSDARGRLECSAALEATGEVELVAQAADDAGRVARAATSVWVSGRGELWFEQDNDDRIDVLPEQREVAPGGTARLQVRMPFREATALVTVEREGVIDARVVTLRGREPVVEVPVPQGAASWAPNVVVGVFVLRGRLRDAPWHSFFRWGWKEPFEWWRAFRHEGPDFRAPTAMVDLSKPAFKYGAAMLSVGVAEHRLDVQVQPDKPQYGVRETARTKVRVTQGGKPAAGAEIAFAAVDEGLLALQGNTSWDLLGALMQPRPWGVETSTAQGEIVGRRHYGRKALPPGGGGGRNPTRELFDTLLLWRATVALDANGEATVDVPLNDSLTSFRLVAVADAGADRFGHGHASVRVTQDLQMLAGLPPLVREGDRFDAGFTLRNTTPRAMTVKASLAGPGAALAPQTVALAAGAAAQVSWPVVVPAGSGRIEWTASAEEQGGPARDRSKIVQAVQPAVPVRVLQAQLQPLEGAVSIPLAPPADALPGSGGVRATLLPKLSNELPGLKRYFQTYPYTCLEQKSSKAIALRDTAAWQALGQEAAGYLDRDGLANYFPPRADEAARGSDRLTAYLVAAAHEAGWSWPAPVQEAMLQGLAAFVEGRLERRFSAPRDDLAVRRLAALEALSRHGRVLPRHFGVVEWAPNAWPTAALLDAWSLLRRVDGAPDRAARLEEVQRLLRARLVAGGTTLRFSTEDTDGWWWLMDSPDGNAARLVLAAAESPAWKDDVPLLVNGTLARQRGGAWSTTTANLWGVLALERFASKFEATPVAGRSTLATSGTPAVVDWAKTPAGATESLPWGTALTARHEGAGRPWLATQTLAAVPLKAPLAAGYRITRSVLPVERKVANAWSRGDTVRVRLEIEAVGDMAWVVVSDPLPAGAAVLGGGLGRDSAIATRGERREGGGWLAYEERAADAWRAYYEWLPRGRHVVEYTLRLSASGRFALPPTRVEAMYAPETFGERPNDPVEVRP